MIQTIKGSLCRTIAPYRFLGIVARQFLPDGVYILLYHHVGDETDWVKGQGVTTPVDTFFPHLDFLTRHFSIISLKEAVDILSKPPVRGVYISITFDDAFKSFFKTVYPEVSRLKIPVCLFVCTQFASSRKIGWRNRLAYLCNTGHAQEVCSAIRIFYPPNFEPLEKLMPEKLMKWTKNHFRQFEIESSVNEVFNSIYGDLSTPLYMNWHEIREVSKNGLVEIGNHSQTHLLLTAATEEQEIEEIQGAQSELERHLGRKICFFAYPYGGPKHYTPRTQKLVSKLRLIGFSAHGGFNQKLNQTDLKRITLTNADTHGLLRKLAQNTGISYLSKN